MSDPSDADHVDDGAMPPTAEPLVGRGIIRASWIGTGAFTVSAVATAIAPHTFVAVGVGVSMVLFFAGIALFLWAFAIAVNRSRADLIGVGGLFFLAGSASRPVQRQLLGSFGLEVVVGLATAAVHPFTPLAFGVLVPMYGLGLCGLWSARYGTFPPRPPDEGRPARKGAGKPADKQVAGGPGGKTAGKTGGKTGGKTAGAAAGKAGGRRAKGGRVTPAKKGASRSR